MRKIYLLLCLFSAMAAQAQTKEETLEWLKVYGSSLLTSNFIMPSKFDVEDNENAGVFRGSFEGYEVLWSDADMAITFNYKYDNSKVVPKTPDSKMYASVRLKFSDIYLPDGSFVIEETDKIPGYYKVFFSWDTKPAHPFYQLVLKTKKYTSEKYETFYDSRIVNDFEIKILCANKENLQRVGNAILNMAKFNGAKKRINPNTY